MNSSSRRTFLKNFFLLTGYAAVAPAIALGWDKKTSPLRLSTQRSSVRLFHTSGLQVSAEHLKSFGSGGIDNIQPIFKKWGEPFLAIDSGGFLNHHKSIGKNIEFIQKMNQLGFAAAGLGKEEMEDGGRLLKTVIDNANFSIVNCNYGFNDSALAQKIKPYQIVYYGDIKIGITGIAPDYGLADVRYKNPITSANNMAERLKVNYQCDLVFCLSAMEQHHNEKQPYYTGVAANSSFIDIIINAHTQKIAPRLQVFKNRNNNDVLVSNVASSGMYLGSYDIEPGDRQTMLRFTNHSTAPGISQPARVAALLNQLEQSAINA